MLNNILETIKNYDPKKIVFWIGAGVDINSPTCLPKANKLVEKLLGLSCGTEKAKMVLEELEMPRMETIIYELKIFEKELKQQESILQIFKYFLEAPPNDCHQVIAQYLRLGSNVVTTNYTDTIQKAYSLQYDVDPSIIKPQYDTKNKMYISCDEKANSGKIFHIHGTSYDLNTIGISLYEVKNTFSQEFQHTLKKWIDNDYYFIFLGYSCSDDLDVNIFLKSCNSINGNNSKALIVSHSNSDEIIPLDKLNENFKDVLYPFNQKNAVSTNTSSFLIQIKKHTYIKCKSLFDNFDFNSINIVSYDKKLNKYFILGLYKTFDFNIGKILGNKWYKNREYELFNRNWYIDYYTYMCLSKSYHPLLLIKYAKKLKNDDLTYSDTLSKLGFTKKAANVCISITEINKFIDNIDINSPGPVIDWNISTSLNRKAQWIIKDILKNPIFCSYKLNTHKNDALEIISCNKKILKLGNDYILDIFQNLTANRYNGVLIMLYQNDYNESNNLLHHSIKHYRNISSIDGEIRCLLYMAFVELLNYKYNKNKESLTFAQKYLNKAKKCSKSKLNPNDLQLYFLITILLIFEKLFI